MALTEIDRNLINRCVEREPGAWQDFVKRFMGLFLHVINHTMHAHSVRAQPDEIEDLCGEIFLETISDDFKVLRNFRGKSSLASYLTVIARRTTLKTLLRKNRSQVFGHVDVHSESLQQADAESIAIKQEELEELEAFMKKLPPEHAAIVKMFHLEGLTYQEIHDKTGLAESSIGSILSRSRTKLKSDNLQV
jgi:RNA polymerase sigma-70 factor (ECF subfamily)